MNSTPFKGIENLEQAFDNLSIDRLARIKEVLEGRTEPTQPPVCPGKALTGLRWQKADRGVPIRDFVHQSTPRNLRSQITKATTYLSQRTKNLRFEFVDDIRTANIPLKVRLAA